jgi:hypothetical protein
LAAVKLCKKGEDPPTEHDFKFAVPLANKSIVTIYIQMRKNYIELLDLLQIGSCFELVLVTDFSKAVGRQIIKKIFGSTGAPTLTATTREIGAFSEIYYANEFLISPAEEVNPLGLTKQTKSV